MKKLILAACLLVAGASTAFAQKKGEFSLGGNVSYLTEAERFGIGAKARYSFTDNIRLEAGANYYFKKFETNFYDFSANLHYVFALPDNFSIYPLAGVSYLHSSTKVLNQTYTDGLFGFNFGGGASYHITPNVSVGAEVKYIFVKDANTPAISANVMFSL